MAFITELKHTKQPDIKAIKDGKEWFIECKRLSKSADYTSREKDKWLKMVSYLRTILLERNMVLDVTIHKELVALTDIFLFDELGEKLKLVKVPGIVVKNDVLAVNVAFVDFEAINSHLEKFSVRSPSPQLNKLISGSLDDNKGFTSGTMARVFRLGTGISWDKFWNSNHGPSSNLHPSS